VAYWWLTGGADPNSSHWSGTAQRYVSNVMSLMDRAPRGGDPLPAAPADGMPIQPRDWRLTTERLRIWEAPGPVHNAIRWLGTDRVLQVRRAEYGPRANILWIRVELPDGTLGWMNSRKTLPSKAPKPIHTPGYTPSTIRAVTDWTPPPPMVVEPVTLEGRIVRLEPLESRHYPALLEVGLAPELWRWTVEWIDTPALLTKYLDLAQQARDEGSQLPFVTVEKSTGKPVGSTRYLNIERAHHRVEIGYTWVAPAWQRSGANLEAKLLQLRHAFETLGCRRVEFKTDSLNEKSNGALLGMGATFEGNFRNHMISQGGRMRHSSYYSVIDTEWPEVRERLEDHVAAHLAIKE